MGLIQALDFIGIPSRDPDGNQLMLHHRYAPYPDA